MSERSSADIERHVRMWTNFKRLVVGGAIGAAVVLIGLAVTFL
ncbi:MAG: hypothetical protein ACE5LL_00465 [Alphaproteobacteria bacterium]